MNIEKLKKIYADKGCDRIYVKKLASNDNSKNQIYFSGSFDVLNIFPLQEIETERDNWKAKISFLWFNDNGESFIAPRSQFILYPQYPEVRFSGFLQGCKEAPSSLMTSRKAGRLLFLGVIQDKVFGYVSDSESNLTKEFNSCSFPESGVFSVIDLPKVLNSKKKLLEELYRIYTLGLIPAKRLDPLGNIIPCDSPNCGGYTLEAELGIRPNGKSAPDYLGWELKQFSVKNFDRISSQTITLMTPEPTGGVYRSGGFEEFMRRYGYDDLNKPDRKNFNGTHYIGVTNAKTNLTLKLVGYDETKELISDPSGCIALMTENNEECATWSFTALLKKWNEKHNQACYVPSMMTKNSSQDRYYNYGSKVFLGEGTDFQLFLSEMAKGHVYYDPGIKIENLSSTPRPKKRSQFRVKSGYITNLYKNNSQVNLLELDL